MKNVQYYMMVYNRSKEGDRNMNILFFQWFAFMQNGIENALKKMNVSYDVFYYDMKDWDNDGELERKLSDYLKNSNVTYDAVFSVNFIPMVSDVCSRLVSEFNTDRYRKLKYISWVYDCPVNIRRTAALKNDCNIIYFFDRIQAESYAKQGVRGAGHMPLAVDTDIFAEAINNAVCNVVENVASNVGNSCISDVAVNERAEFKDKGILQESILCNNNVLPAYACDVAFVGKLYRSDYQYISKYQDEYTRGYLEGIVSTQEKIYGGYIIDDCVNDNIMKCINDNFAKVSGGTYSVIKPEVTYALATEVTGRERYKALALLQNRCRVNLYSTDKDDRLSGLNQCGPVDYYNQMPLAFNQAKINLNISLKIIQSGIPLRVFDVLGCGGFLITNYQQEIAENFEDGRELVIYEDIPDLIAKVDYYLSHDDERLRIACNGYEKVKSECTFEKRMNKILSGML